MVLVQSILRGQANIITANGLGWSPDGSVFYHTD